MIQLHQPRCTCNWDPAGTTTFRLSSKSLFKGKGSDGFGTNLQNVDHNLLDLFVSDPGKTFVQPDQSGAEALCVAYLCRPGRFRQLFENQIKPHTFVALHLFKTIWYNHFPRPLIDELCGAAIPDLQSFKEWRAVAKLIKQTDEWPSNQRYYFISKTGCHSSNYDATYRVLQRKVMTESEGQIILSDQESLAFTHLYHVELFPEIREWHTDVDKEIIRTKTLSNMFGFPRVFIQQLSTSTSKRDSFAFIPQSTVGTITNIAFTEMQYWIEDNNKLDWDLMNNKHDSYMCQVPDADVMECKEVMQNFLCKELVGRDGVKFKMRSECRAGKSWGKGMVEI